MAPSQRRATSRRRKERIRLYVSSLGAIIVYYWKRRNYLRLDLSSVYSVLYETPFSTLVASRRGIRASSDHFRDAGKFARTTSPRKTIAKRTGVCDGRFASFRPR